MMSEIRKIFNEDIDSALREQDIKLGGSYEKKIPEGNQPSCRLDDVANFKRRIFDQRRPFGKVFYMDSYLHHGVHDKVILEDLSLDDVFDKRIVPISNSSYTRVFKGATFEGAGVTHVGEVAKHFFGKQINQDSMAISPFRNALFAVADGCGDLGGAYAAREHTHALEQGRQKNPYWDTLLTHQSISQYSAPFFFPATTVVAATYFAKGVLYVHWVGDSRFIKLDKEGGVQYGTIDDRAEGTKSLSQSLGVGDNLKVIHTELVSIQLGEMIVLASDGITEFLETEELAKIIRDFMSEGIHISEWAPRIVNGILLQQQEIIRRKIFSALKLDNLTLIIARRADDVPCEITLPDTPENRTRLWLLGK